MTFKNEEERREALGLGGGKTLDDYVLDDEEPGYFAGEPGGYFADEPGFRDPGKAAQHAAVVQGGTTSPLREAGRMIKDGGIHAERARAWLTAHGYTEQDTE